MKVYLQCRIKNKAVHKKQLCRFRESSIL